MCRFQGLGFKVASLEFKVSRLGDIKDTYKRMRMCRDN